MWQRKNEVFQNRWSNECPTVRFKVSFVPISSRPIPPRSISYGSRIIHRGSPSDVRQTRFSKKEVQSPCASWPAFLTYITIKKAMTDFRGLASIRALTKKKYAQETRNHARISRFFISRPPVPTNLYTRKFNLCWDYPSCLSSRRFNSPTSLQVHPRVKLFDCTVEFHLFGRQTHSWVD